MNHIQIRLNKSKLIKGLNIPTCDKVDKAKYVWAFCDNKEILEAIENNDFMEFDYPFDVVLQWKDDGKISWGDNELSIESVKKYCKNKKEYDKYFGKE